MMMQIVFSHHSLPVRPQPCDEHLSKKTSLTFIKRLINTPDLTQDEYLPSRKIGLTPENIKCLIFSSWPLRSKSTQTQILCNQSLRKKTCLALIKHLINVVRPTQDRHLPSRKIGLTPENIKCLIFWLMPSPLEWRLTQTTHPHQNPALQGFVVSGHQFFRSSQ